MKASLMRALACALATAALPSASTIDAAQAAFGEGALRRGDSGHDVRVLQGWLGLQGFTTPVDGAFGPGTARAVRHFERREHLIVDGWVSRADARRLRALVESTPDAQPTAPADPSPGQASLTPDGRMAVAPPDAPAVVGAAIAGANALTREPYRYGGGHGDWNSSGYDCSGTVSFVLHAASLLSSPLDSTGLARWGSAGRGRWISVYGNRAHAYMVIAGLRFDTSGTGESGPRWRPQRRSGHGFAVRHAPGL